MASILRLGAACLGAGALLWSAASLRSGDLQEAAWCGVVAAGWLLLASSLWARGARGTTLAGAGLLLAAAGATYWMLAPLAQGAVLSPWVLYGAGMQVAAALALLLWWVRPWRAGLAWAFPAALALVLAAGAKLALAGLGGDPLHAGAVLLTLLGAALATLRPGPAYLRALALAH